MPTSPASVGLVEESGVTLNTDAHAAESRERQQAMPMA
jgi:hypothetical protein